jgi:aryl-alcohol dehydrogenase-like predicted oxidoreductase
MADFLEKVPLGRTGLRVSRLGIGSSSDPPAEVIEEAFERGVNYLYWGTFRRAAFGRAMRNLARRHREEIVLTVQSYSRVPALVGPSVELALLRSRVGYFDILLLGMRNERPSRAYVEAYERLREQGKVRFLALSTHNRSLLPSLFDEFREGKSPYDIFMLRYNAVHRGAERDVFPFVPSDPRPGIIAYTATRWGHLLDPRKMPDAEAPPAASDCYRFALGQPAVDLVLCGPANRSQMQEALRALELGPLDLDGTKRMQRIGDSIYGRYRPRFSDRADAKPVDPGTGGTLGPDAG